MTTRTTQLLLLVLLLAGCSSNAPRPPTLASSSSGGASVRMEGGVVVSARGRFSAPAGTSPTERARGFLTRFGGELGWSARDLAERLTVGAPVGTQGGATVVVFDERIGGVPVLGHQIRVHLAPDGAVFYVSSVPPLPGVPSLTPTLDAGAAVARALETSGRASSQSPLQPPTLALYRHPRGDSALVYRVALAPRGPSAPVLLIDAHDGRVLRREDAVARARNRRTYSARHSADTDAIEAGARDLWLDETGIVAGTMPDQEGLDAHDYALLVHDYYDSILGRDSFDGAGATLTTYVHYNTATAPANAMFWADAMWIQDGMVAYDIYVHEFTHAVVAHTAGLVYAEDSGAVNESMADVFAMFAGRTDTWQVGANSVLGVIRSLADPGSFGDPGNMSEYRSLLGAQACTPGGCGPSASCTGADGTCTAGCSAPRVCDHGFCRTLPDCTNDSGYVHSNSGILNHAAYLLTSGGVDVGGRHVAGIGFEKAEQIYYKALGAYLHSDASLADARDAVVAACEELHVYYPLLGLPNFGITAHDCGVVINAFATVGLGEGDRDFDAWEDSQDNCPTVANFDQADADGNRVGDACDTPADGGVPPAEASFPCPAAFPTQQNGTWPLMEHWLQFNQPPTYQYNCRYSNPGGTQPQIGSTWTFSIHWRTDSGDGFPGCGVPPPNPGEELASDTHKTYVGTQTWSTEPLVFRDDVRAFMRALLATSEAGVDSSTQQPVTPAGAWRCP